METMNDCGCGVLCRAALAGHPENCPRPNMIVVDLATREPASQPYDAARSTLETAADYVAGERAEHYGHPLDNHRRTAVLWRAYLLARFDVDLDLTPEDVCWLNSQQKLARDIHAPKPDGPIDVAGYAANVAEIRAERSRRGEV